MPNYITLQKIGLYFISAFALTACATTDISNSGDSPNTSFDELVAAYETIITEESPYARAGAAGTLPAKWPKPEIEVNIEKTALLEKYKAIEAGLTDELSLEEALFGYILQNDIETPLKHNAMLPFTGDWGFHLAPVSYLRSLDLKNQADLENYLSLLEDTPAYLKAYIEAMQMGIEEGFTGHKDPHASTLDQLEGILALEGGANPFLAALASLPESVSAQASFEDQKARAQAASGETFKAYQALYDFLAEDYAPHLRPRPGIGTLEAGKDYYAHYVRHHTTLRDITPEEIHETGLKEVKRIRAEMETLIEESGFKGSFSEFLDFLRTDPQFYAKTEEELMQLAARLSKKLDGVLPKYFETLPRLPYSVEPVPKEIEKGFTTARYSSGDMASGKAGEFWVNTYNLKERPLYELPSLAAHEAVPGHHLQIARAQEVLKEAAQFRRNYQATAFVEGWALYAESLAWEAGLYETVYDKFGKLSNEMWRACRLVADTGLHYYDWSREEAESCFRENTALAEHNIKTEVTRYIGWPGQALGYKMGELKIKALRQHEEERLGEDFDIRNFHNEIIDNGPLPLSLLEAQIHSLEQSKMVVSEK